MNDNPAANNIKLQLITTAQLQFWQYFQPQEYKQKKKHCNEEAQKGTKDTSQGAFNGNQSNRGIKIHFV